VRFKKGRNVLTALVDNLGRFATGDRLGEHKGIFGHIYDARVMRTNKFKLNKGDSFPRRVIPRNLGHRVERLESMSVWTADLTISLKEVVPIHMAFSGIPHDLAISCNDRPMDFFAKGEGDNFGAVTFGANLTKGKNNIRLLLWGDVDAAVLSNLTFHVLQEPVSADAEWSCRPFDVPGETHGGKNIKGMSAWFETKFKYPVNEVRPPLYLGVKGGKKGRVYLNGHDLGRFWSAGPQNYCYLPECWLEEKNRLLIFEEHGVSPSTSKLYYLPEGPFG
jgi:hypothetical protein